MKVNVLSLFILLLLSCKGSGGQSELYFKATLAKPLKEISGLVADGNNFWAITDKPKAIVYKLDAKGKIEQEVTVRNASAVDVESVTTDDTFVYIGDTGDNEGNREERQIIKVRKAAIAKGSKADVDGETITFRFSDEVIADKKKKNNYDCEAILNFRDSLYLFTKRRTDMHTELFSLPKTAGNYIARSIGIFDSKGLVTDAAINGAGNEVALTGYNKGHKFPFMIFLKGFIGNNFFNGESERIELADKPWDWQMESITYTNDNKLYFACEETKEVKSTMYAIERDKVQKLNKKR